MTDVVALDDEAIDRYATVLAGVATALAIGDLDGAARLLTPIAGERWTGRTTIAGSAGPGGQKRPRMANERLRAEVFLRDRFRCSFCNGPAIARSVLVAVSDVFPQELPYHAHYKHGQIHPVYWALACEADHTLAHSRGGMDTLDNLTTMHAYCNTRKADVLVDELPPSRDRREFPDWDGLISLYPAIVSAGDLQGRRHSGPDYHPAWMRRFGVAAVS